MSEAVATKCPHCGAPLDSGGWDTKTLEWVCRYCKHRSGTILPVPDAIRIVVGNTYPSFSTMSINSRKSRKKNSNG